MTYFETIRKSLLIVESDPEKRNLLLTYFKKGVRCEAVGSLDEALDAAVANGIFGRSCPLTAA